MIETRRIDGSVHENMTAHQIKLSVKLGLFTVHDEGFLRGLIFQ